MTSPSTASTVADADADAAPDAALSTAGRAPAVAGTRHRILSGMQPSADSCTSETTWAPW